MGLFGEKKKSGQVFHALSEKEIQDKLYGSFRSRNVTNPEISLGPRNPSDRKSSSSIMIQEPQKTSSSPSSPDLFTETSKPVNQAPSQSSVPDDKSKNYFEWIEKEESSVLRHSRPETFQTPSQAGLRKAPVASKISSGVKIGQVTSQSLSLLGKLIQAIVSGLRAIIYAIQSLDWRNPGVKKTATVIISGAVLASLMFGIHHLNSSREQAMKSHRPAPPVVEAPPMTIVEEPPQAVVPEKPVLSAPSARETEEDLPYVIQAATYASSKDAEDLMSRFQQEGLNAFVKPLKRSGGKTYYCVFLGRFKDYRDAEAKLSEFKKKTSAQPFQDAFVRTLD